MRFRKKLGTNVMVSEGNIFAKNSGKEVCDFDLKVPPFLQEKNHQNVVFEEYR
jgi:hypothetical protein